MFEEGVAAAGGISFICSVLLSQGAEFTVLGDLSSTSLPGKLPILESNIGFTEIQVEEGTPAKQRYVVMRRTENGEKLFLCEALPADLVDREARAIEQEVVRRLTELSRNTP